MNFLTVAIYPFAFFAGGIVMMVFGILKISYYADYDLFLDHRIFVAPTLMIVTACCIFSFCVFLSKIFSEDDALETINCESVCFFVLPVVIIILQLSATIEVFVVRDKIDSFLRYEMQESMKHYQFDSNNPNNTTLLWDRIQLRFECCGTNGPEDWSDWSHKVGTEFDWNRAQPSHNFTVSTGFSESNNFPWSCCNEKGTGIDCKLNDTGSYFKTGCLDLFGNNLKYQTLTIGLVCMILFYLNTGMCLSMAYAMCIED